MAGVLMSRVRIRQRPRRSRVRSKTIAAHRITQTELRLGRIAYPLVDIARPTTREQCRDGERPCPWVACKHHLYLDINPETGSIKFNFPDLEVDEMTESCSLDIAESGAKTLEEVGLLTNLTRERIRQIEVRGLVQLKSDPVLAIAGDELEPTKHKPPPLHEIRVVIDGRTDARLRAAGDHELDAAINAAIDAEERD